MGEIVSGEKLRRALNEKVNNVSPAALLSLSSLTHKSVQQLYFTKNGMEDNESN